MSYIILSITKPSQTQVLGVLKFMCVYDGMSDDVKVLIRGVFLFDLMHSFDYCSLYWGKEMCRIQGENCGDSNYQQTSTNFTSLVLFSLIFR